MTLAQQPAQGYSQEVPVQHIPQQQQQQQYYDPQDVPHMAAPALAPASAPEIVVVKRPVANTVIEMPFWFIAIYGMILFLTLPILGLSAWIMHDLYLNCNGLSLVISLFTWFAVAYAVLTEKLASLRKFYHIFALLAVSSFMWLMWLVTMAVVAHKRAQFKTPVTLTNCSSSSSLINSTTCTIIRRWRIEVLTKKGLDAEIAIACLSALQMILYAFVVFWLAKAYLNHRKSTAAPTATLESQPISAEKPSATAFVPGYAPVFSSASDPVYTSVPGNDIPTSPSPPSDPVSALSSPMPAHTTPFTPPPMAIPSDLSELPPSPQPQQPQTVPESSATPSPAPEIYEMPSMEQNNMNPPVELYAGDANLKPNDPTVSSS